MEEINARLTSDLDQAAAGTKTFAILLAAYHRNLIEAGFTRDEALVILCEYQEVMLNRGASGG